MGLGDGTFAKSARMRQKAPFWPRDSPGLTLHNNVPNEPTDAPGNVTKEPTVTQENSPNEPTESRLDSKIARVTKPAIFDIFVPSSCA